YHVEQGGELVIPEGVTIKAATEGVPYILIEQGGKINAQGTKDKPIVMTSDKSQPGAWGGVHICGKAPINLSGGKGKSEIGDAEYGGNDAADNSGVLRYIRLEYTGFAFNEEKESNGFTFYGVGNSTIAEYLQTYMGADDGFEWFGGTVNAKYLVSTGSEDDSFDWTEGWVGKGQFWVAQQAESGDCLIEADNLSGNFQSTPVSFPTIANLTLIGNNSADAARGVRLRAGTFVKMYNALITGKSRAVTIETTETIESFKDNTSKVMYVWASGEFDKASEVAKTFDLAAIESNAVNADFTLNGFIGTVAGGEDLSSDAFFVKTAYKGAVAADNNWTQGWTRSL
ncbi:MAG: hypothetical protein ACRCS7_01480, partial [Tannerellaceae bacterium]